jgi:hypothetical protein
MVEKMAFCSGLFPGHGVLYFVVHSQHEQISFLTANRVCRVKSVLEAAVEQVGAIT